MARVVGWAIVDRFDEMQWWGPSWAAADRLARDRNVTMPQGSPWMVKPLAFASASQLTTDQEGAE